MSRYEKSGQVGSSYFSLIKRNYVGQPLSFFLKQFNLDEYYILKRSNMFRLITQEDFLEEKWSGYIFFKKSNYELEHINLWIEFIMETKMRVRYLNEPFPPFDPYDKIEEIKI